MRFSITYAESLLGSQGSATCCLLSDDDTESVRKNSSPNGQTSDITYEGFTLIGQ